MDRSEDMAVDNPKRRFGWRMFVAGIVTAALLVFGISELLKPLPNGCNMTYMYPTYVPVPPAPQSTSTKYGLFLYHEGWQPIDFAQHLRGISGVPVLFIPGNGGSYKQVRSLAAEADRAYNAGPLEETYYKESGFTPEEAGLKAEKWQESLDSHANVRELLAEADLQGEYVNRLDLFAVDLEGEHSALDGRILEEHTNYVVEAIHRILDLYKESLHARSGNKDVNEETLPRSVILVGHSMGGFVARAAVVHPSLRKGAVETVLTVSSPHLLAPLALQPSLGHFFSRINRLWRSGYETTSAKPHVLPPLSNVIVVSVPGGVNDYQVRSRMAALDGVIPATHSLTVGAPGMVNAWVSTEHQTILWCNQLVVQVAHTLLKLVDKNTGQAFSNPRTRLAIFTSKFRSAIPQTFDWLPAADPGFISRASQDGHKALKIDRYTCPRNVQWESRERDLRIDASSVTVLAMDGRRRWLDIQKQASFGKTSFVLVTNLSPCIGIRVHLWPEKSKEPGKKIEPVEVTRNMVQIPAGPAPRQSEPGGQSEQAPPSGVLRLSKMDLEGFRYLTISVAPRLTVVGRPPPATSMAVGQFISEDPTIPLSPWRILYSAYGKQDIVLEENHSMVMNFTAAVGFGVLPLVLDVQTTSCGISSSKQEKGDIEVASLCKLRCFPPVALVWDEYSGLQVLPNVRSETIVSDSSAVLTGLPHGSLDSSMILLVDPHCGYNISFEVAKAVAVKRFILTHGSQIGGFLIAALFFALMRQARAWELDKPFPSVHACLEGNLIFPVPFIPLCLGPLVLYLFFVMFGGGPSPPFVLSSVMAVVCYTLANGVMALLAFGSMVAFHVTTSLQVILQSRWQTWFERWNNRSLQRFFTQLSACFNLQMVKKIRAMPRLTMGVVATVLVFFLHPVLGLAVVLVAHAWSCHVNLCRYRERRTNGSAHSVNGFKSLEEDRWRNGCKQPEKESLIDAKLSQLESFKFFQGLLLLHLTSTALLFPSFIAWIHKPKVEQTLPWFMDSLLSFGVILHGLYATNGGPDSLYFNCLPLSCGLSFVYGSLGLYTCWAGLALAPYRAFYALAFLGLLTSAIRYYRGNNTKLASSRFHLHRH